MNKSELTAMAFYNPKGFVPAFKHAKAFAGEGGRVATLPDIIEARLATAPGSVPWEQYFTTMSAEYVGLTKARTPIAIVAHGVGPMSTLDGVLAAYSYEFNDKSRENRGGRISQEEFLKLESGVYGEVQVVDLAATWKRREYQFSNHPVTRKEIEEEPLWQARLGRKWLEYCRRHEDFSDDWQKERGECPYLRPCILAMYATSIYSCEEFFDIHMLRTPGMAIAHLLSIDGLMNSYHQYYEHDYQQRENRTSLACDVSCHEWWNGTRMLGVRPGEIKDIHPGLSDYDESLKHHFDRLWAENPKGEKQTTSGFWHLVWMAKHYFTDYPKQGERMDSHEPEFLVTGIKEIFGGPKVFRTTIGGYHGFFKYGMNEVRRIAPPGANAYMLGEPTIESHDGNPTHHVAPVKFYRVEVDTSRRLVRMDEIYRNFDLMMSLID